MREEGERETVHVRHGGRDEHRGKQMTSYFRAWRLTFFGWWKTPLSVEDLDLELSFCKDGVGD